MIANILLPFVSLFVSSFPVGLMDGPYINFTVYVPWGLAAVFAIAGIIYAIKSIF